MSETKRLRWGLMGCGDIARKRVAPALGDLANCELVAVNRARAELAEEFAREFGARRWYRDWRELLADPEIEAVYIATPVDLHAEQTIAAAEAGKHVLCEKPMALNVAECDRMIAACRAHGVQLGIAYYRHFYPVLNRVQEVIESGEIGVPVLAQVNAFEMFNPQPGDPRFWLVDRARAGGGPMMDFGCHRLELLIKILGPVKSAVGLVRKVLFDRAVEDTAVATLEFENRACGVLTVTHAAYEPQDTVSIFGSRGSLAIPLLNRGELRIRTPDGERVESHPPHRNIHQPLIDDFARAVLDAREPRVGGAIGREVARLEEEIYLQTDFRSVGTL